MTVRVPKYRLHKPTGQALVEIQGRRIYLGKHNSPESREKYRRLVAELLSTGTAQSLPTEVVASPPSRNCRESADAQNPDT